jgi:hypothetical protein
MLCSNSQSGDTLGSIWFEAFACPGRGHSFPEQYCPRMHTELGPRKFCWAKTSKSSQWKALVSSRVNLRMFSHRSYYCSVLYRHRASQLPQGNWIRMQTVQSHQTEADSVLWRLLGWFCPMRLDRSRDRSGGLCRPVYRDLWRGDSSLERDRLSWKAKCIFLGWNAMSLNPSWPVCPYRIQTELLLRGGRAQSQGSRTRTPG